MTLNRFLGVSALLVTLTSGCAQHFDATSLGVPVTMSAAAGDTVAGQRFVVTRHSVHGVLGLVTISEPNLAKVLGAQLVGGKGVANLKIKVRSRWSDLLISGLSFGLIIPRTITYEGTVLK